MNAKGNAWRPGAVMRHLIFAPALVVALSLAFTGAASAQTAFQASVSGVVPKPKPPCPTTTFCGSASIAGYGPATWTLNVTNNTTVSPACFTYQAVTTFELLSDDSTLVLDESGLVCGPGNSYPALPPTSFGGPLKSTGSWTVDPLSNGQFSGLTGAGTDALHTAGAQSLAHTAARSGPERPNARPRGEDRLSTSRSSHPGIIRRDSPAAIVGLLAKRVVDTEYLLCERRARILIISTMLHSDVSHYLDGRKIGVFAGAAHVPGEDAPLELFSRQDDATDYREAEQRRA